MSVDSPNNKLATGSKAEMVCTGSHSLKKAAKRRAAEVMLTLLGFSPCLDQAPSSSNASDVSLSCSLG